MRKTLSIVALLVVAIVGYAAAGPYITLHQIKSGIEERDAEKLSEHIDFPSLRANLKEQLNALITKEASSELRGNPFAAVAMGIASKLVEGIVDAFVTPSGLASLMEGKRPQQSDGGSGHSAGSGTHKREPFKNARYTYDSLSKFSAWVEDDNGKPIRFVFTRNGLSWQLTNIVLPLKG